MPQGARGRALGVGANVLALASVVLLVGALVVPGVLVGVTCAAHTLGCREEYSSWFGILVQAGPRGIGLLAPWALWVVVAVPGIVLRRSRGPWAGAHVVIAVLLALSCALLMQGHDAGWLGAPMILGCGAALIAAVLHARREAVRRRAAA